MKFSFSNKNLQSIHVSAEQSISSHLAKLDEVSNDIKTLEAVLSKSGISVNFLYLFENAYEKRLSRVDEDEYVNVRVHIQHFIVWNRDKQRLLYEVHETESEIVENPRQQYRQWGPHIIHSKPLIETKTHIRLKVLPELELFYKQIIKLLGQGQLQERIIDRSSPSLEIPF